MATHHTNQDAQSVQSTLLVTRNMRWASILTLFSIFALVYVVAAQWPLWHTYGSSTDILWIFFLPMDLFCGLLLWRLLTRHLFSRSPVLAIGQDGIQIGTLPTSASDHLFIAWNEIESIYAHRLVYTQLLCIRPKNTTQFLSRFGRGKKFFMRLQMRNGALINIPQIYMQKSAAEVATLLSSLYAQEVRDAAIQLHN